ncbi:MAG: 4-alpha-L-fucosyltransferase [Robiginitomaculum sp.]|nr:MAG: 4-alpha-L-fucosyltransferase [Robiginitomaculum sp.]
MIMLIHIFADTPHHYVPMRQFFTEQCDIAHKQLFWAKSSINNVSQQTKENSNVLESKLDFKYYSSVDDLFSLLNLLPNSAQIIFHGLADVHLLKRLLFSPWLKRSSCVIWGYELYRYQQKKRSVKSYITQFIHLLVFKFINNVIMLTPGDGALVQKYLHRKSVTFLPYPLIGVSPVSKHLMIPISKNNNKIKILVGNSAAKANEHITAFQQLAHLADENIEIVVPLNYANSGNYSKEVINAGEAIFATKFTAITEMLTKKAYDELLTEVDITVFAHHRQQGLYVAYSMLLMGKTIFLRSATTSYQNFVALEFSIFAFETLKNYTFSQLFTLITNKKLDNQRLMEENFTEQALAPKWSLLLNNLFCR